MFKRRGSMFTNINMISIATKLGSKQVSVSEIANMFGLKTEYVSNKNGLNKLFMFNESEDIIDISVHTAKKALAKHDIDVCNIDGIFGSGNLTCPTIIPTYTATVAHHLGLRNVICDHVGIGCCGGLQAFRNAYNQLIADGIKDKTSYYLVILGDEIRHILDPKDLLTNIFFSDGICAILLTNDLRFRTTGYKVKAVETRALLNENFQALSLKNPFVHKDEECFFQMDGREVLQFGLNTIDHMIDMLRIDTSLENHYLIPHQANRKMLGMIIKKHNLNPERVYTNGFPTIGNTLNASTFFGLHDAIRNNLFDFNSFKGILLAFGAELQIGVAELDPISPEEILA